ncbi:MAG: GNAT family N-acetyltransferase [Chitinophagaceae bacterium]|nr:GNAT family N-acetyltransferase [Chitinophagaceae bacterium]
MKFDFNTNLILENNIALLRPLELNDFELLKHFSNSEPELWTYSLVPADTEEKLKLYIASAIEARKNKKEFPFVIIDKRTNEIAGSTRFYDIQLQHDSLQLGYTWIGKNFQGTNLNKNCKYLLLQFAFEHLKCERVEFRADFLNKKSIAAMLNIGCKQEGILRSHFLKLNGERRDSIILSILKNEWHENLKTALLAKIKS